MNDVQESLEIQPTQEVQLTKKSVFAIHIIPSSGSLNVQSRKIQIQLAKAAGEQYKKLPVETRENIEVAIKQYVHAFRSGLAHDMPPVLLQPRFSISLKKLAEEIGYNPSMARRLTTNLDQLVSTQVRFNALMHRASPIEQDQYPDEVDVTTSLISSYLRSGSRISWGYDPVILSIMVNPQTYAQLNLNLVRNARTYAALALYENTKRFMHIGRTGNYPIKEWQALLSEDGIVPSWEDASEFRRKLRRTLGELKACEACDIEIEPIESKDDVTGKKMLAFLVKEKQQLSHDFGMNIPENKSLFNDMLAMGVTKAKAQFLMDRYPEDLLVNKRDMLQKKIKSGTQIRNQAGWFIEAVDKGYIDQESNLAKLRIRQENEARIEAEKQKILSEFKRFQVDVIKERYQSLDEDTQINLMLRMQTHNNLPMNASNTMPKNILLQSLYSYIKEHVAPFEPGWLEASYEKNIEDYQTYRATLPTQ